MLWFEEQLFPKAYLEAMAIPGLIVCGHNDMITWEHDLEIHDAIKNSQFCGLANGLHNYFGKTGFDPENTCQLF